VLTRRDEPLTVDEIAEAVDRERSTAYRSVQRLRDAGLVDREQVNYQDGGYYHVFEPVDADAVADRMQRMLNDWYAQLGGLVGEYREKYEGEPTRVTTER
jgi:predicted transcriptional regulator